MIKILDCTTRDGGHTTNWNFEKYFVQELIKCQNKSNISFYEIGYRNHFDNANKGTFYNCSPEFLEQYYKIKGKIQLGVMTDTKRFSIKDFPGQENDYIDFIRIACHPDKIKETLSIAENLYDKGYEIFVQLMDISNIDNFGYKILEKWTCKNILKSLYCADSYGIITPLDLEKIFIKLKTADYQNISFHGHNNSNLALKNSLTAIKLGAYSVDITLNGIGRGGGNLNAAELLNILNNFSAKHYNQLSEEYAEIFKE